MNAGVLIALVLLGLGAGAWVLGLVWLQRRVSAACPPQGRFIETRAGRLHYVEEGRGPTILLLHGLGGQCRHFTYSVTGRLKDGFRVVALDRPGAGHSARSGHHPLTLGAQAELIADLIDRLGLDRPLLVGHSMGGAVALATALRCPERISGLVLISPYAQVQTTVPGPFRSLTIRDPLLRALIGWTLAVPMSIRNRHRTLATVFGPEAPPADFAVRGGGLLSLRPKAFMTASAELCAAGPGIGDLVAQYPRMRLPVGLLHGDGDRVMDFGVHAVPTSRQIPDIDFQVVKGGGHMLPVTAPAQVAGFIRATAGRAFAAQTPDQGGRTR